MNETNFIFNIITKNPNDAIIYIIVVLVWYSLSFVLLIAMSNANKEDFSEYSKDRVFRENHNQEVLKELVDRENRQRLWDIYLGKSEDRNEKIIQAETVRIRNIQRQLAVIDQHQQDNEFLYVSHEDVSYRNSLPSLNPRPRIRRSSSVDRQILQEWKILADELKTHEHWPWGIQKLFIRRHLKRHRRATECESVP